VSRLTNKYHQITLGLAETSNNEIAWEVSQQVLDRLWIAGLCGEASVATSSSAVVKSIVLDATATAPSAAAIDFEDTVYACQACGYLLHPGWRGTYLRVKRPKPFLSVSTKKTVRRREQRRRKRMARAEEMKANNKNRSRSRRSSSSYSLPKPSSSSIKAGSEDANDEHSKVRTTNQHKRLLVLRDDLFIGRLDRNHLVLSCGRCGKKTYFKGLRRDQSQNGPTNEATGNTTRRKNGNLVSSNSNERAVDGTTAGNGNLEENFEPLPPVENQASRKNKNSSIRPLSQVSEAEGRSTIEAPPPPPLSLLEQRREEKFGRRKKRKKKETISSPNKKSGNLLDFLSSLNDH